MGPDPALHHEVESAIALIPDMRPITHYVPDYGRGVEAARSRQPDMIIVEMTRDLLGLKTFVEEIAIASPGTQVVAVFYQNMFGPDVNESAFLIDSIRSGVRDFMRRPISSTDIDQFLDRQIRRNQVRTSSGRGKVVSFFTYKGGVGKSTLAVNTACALARRFPERVLLIDGSIQMGICAPMLDLNPTTTMTDAVREAKRLDETLVRQLASHHSSGLHVLAAPTDAREGALVDEEVVARVINLARRTYDYVVVDTFPMIDRVMLTILDVSDCAYLITESIVPVLQGTLHMLHVLDDIGLSKERRRLVLNRYSSSMGHLSPEEVTKRLGLEFDHIVPYENGLIVAANVGEPFVLKQKAFNSFTKSIERIADEISIRSVSTVFGTDPRIAANGKGKG